MELRLFSALGLVLSLSLSADPAPGTVAPLSAHLREVNKEWSRHSAVLINEDRMVRFDDEAQRIAAHLRLVHRTLSAMDMEQLSPTQVRWRRALLDELQAYAHRGLFPRNEVLPYRTPVFIDPYGTPCAVGRLMIASGHADLARRIDGAMETAYIQEMGLDEVAQWAVEHGFSQEELEWIQPSYASGVQWTGFAGAPTEHVRVVLKLGNGDMVEAIALSMSIPFAFKPVYIEGGVRKGDQAQNDAYQGLYVDGGMLNNYPVRAFDTIKQTAVLANGQPLQFRNEQVNAFLAVDPVEGTGGNEPFLGFKLVDLGRNDPPMVQDDAPLRAFPVDEVFKDDPWALKSLMKDLYFSFMYTSTRGQLRYANDRSRTVSLNVFELELLDFAHPVADQVAGKSIERKRKIDRIEEARKRIMARVEP